MLDPRVWPLLVVVFEIFGDQMVKVPRPQHDESVEALDLDALDEPLDDGVEAG
jgi:hypothetical protein